MNDSTLLLDIGQSAGSLPDTTPVPARYGSWFPVPHSAAPIGAVENGSTTPVADGMLIEWNPSEHPDVQYRIERAPNASGPWTLMGYTQEPRYRVSDPSGATWYYRITPIIRGRAGASITVEGASKQAPDIQDLIAQQTALDAEILARSQGDFQTALAAAADAEVKANAALTTATAHAEARVAQAEAASIAGDTALAQSLQAVQTTVSGKADASVVQLMQTKVSGLEAEGHNSNLLTNSTFNSGTRQWFKSTGGSAWSPLAVNFLGDNWHPPGINNLGISCATTLTDGSQFGQIYSARVPVTPGQRYMASCYIATHRCNARLYIMWRSADAWLSSTATANLGNDKPGGTSLDNWRHASVAGTAPAGAVYAQIAVRFVGDGGNNPYGWILRPMLEQARSNQTQPSPWNSGGMETSADYTLVLSVDSGSGQAVSGMRMHNDGTVSDITMMADIFRIISPAGASSGLELKDGTLRVFKNNVQRIMGNGFGQGSDLMDYFGPNVGTADASKTNAVMWMDTAGNAEFKGTINAQKIAGAIQHHTLISWIGMAKTFQNSGAGGDGTGLTPTVTTFTLPAPTAVNESHIPYMHVVVEMQNLTALVSLMLEVWEGGAWKLVTKREGPYVHHAWSGGDNARPLMEQYIPFSAFHAPVTGERQFRIRATSRYARNLNNNTGLSAYVTKVHGYIVGIR